MWYISISSEILFQHLAVQICSGTMWGKDPQVDGNGGNALICPSNPVRLGLNLLTDLIEISELLPFAVQELGPLCGVKMTRERKTQTDFSYTCVFIAPTNSRSEIRLHLCWH